MKKLLLSALMLVTTFCAADVVDEIGDLAFENLLTLYKEHVVFEHWIAGKHHEIPHVSDYSTYTMFTAIKPIYPDADEFDTGFGVLFTINSNFQQSECLPSISFTVNDTGSARSHQNTYISIYSGDDLLAALPVNEVLYAASTGANIISIQTFFEEQYGNAYLVSDRWHILINKMMSSKQDIRVAWSGGHAGYIPILGFADAVKQAQQWCQSALIQNSI